MATTYTTREYIQTIVVYICFFIPTLLFAYTNSKFVNKKRNTNNRAVIIFSAIMVVLIPAILAGLRDATVGTDVLYYAKDTLIDAHQSRSYLTYALSTNSNKMSSLEWGYMLFVYLISKFTQDYHWLLFFTSIFINLFVYISFYRTRKLISITLAEFLFLFTGFNESMNIMRQCMAMSIVLLAITYLIEYKYKKSIIIVLCSCLFHIAGLVGLIIIFTFFYLEKSKNKVKKNKNLKLFLVGTALLAILVFFGQISQILGRTGLLGQKFTVVYFSGRLQGDFSALAFVVYCIGAVILFLKRKKIRNPEFWISMCLFDVILYALRIYVFNLYRVATFFFYCRFISLAQINSKKLRKLRRAKITKENSMYLYTIGYAILYWMILIIRFKYNGTMPYTSTIFGIN